MIRLFTGKKGMSLIEVLVAMSVLGIIAVPLFALFTNSAVIMKLNERQLKISALLRTVKQNVSEAVKNGGNLPEYGNANYDNVLKAYKDLNIAVPLVPSAESVPLGITDSNGTADRYRDYKYTLQYAGKPDEVLLPNTLEYRIRLYDSSGRFIQAYKADINKLPDD